MTIKALILRANNALFPSGYDRRRNRLFKGMRNSDGDAEVESNSKDRPREQSSSTSKEGWTQKIKRAVVGSH